MTEHTKLHDRLETIIARMQKIQRMIKATPKQPAADYELRELKQLGMEYAEIMQSLEQLENAR